MKPLFITIPHSGEFIPPEADWLLKLPENIRMFDVDRFVDRLYKPTLETMQIPSVIAKGHRYVADLNRLPEDIDKSSVEGALLPAGTHSMGFHWVKTTRGYQLLPHPISRLLHEKWVSQFYDPFHEQVRAQYSRFKQQSFRQVYQIDAHSMPSLGTSAHRDPGQKRADIVVSDQEGKSCDPHFKDLVIAAYEKAGFKTAYNWPYLGGRVTQVYGQPDKGQNCIQVELNRALYMDEESKMIKVEASQEVADKILVALRYILQSLEI